MIDQQLLLAAVPLAVMLAAGIAEWLHARRVRRLGRLPVGPVGGPRRWTRAAAPLRVLATGAMAWGLISLMQLDQASGRPARDESQAGKSPHHLVIGLDVSPSMAVVDAGPHGKQSRADRARDVLRSALERLDLGRANVSVIAFYSDARPVVVDTHDPEVVFNILGDLPLEHAFRPGQTNLYDVVRAADELSAKWPPAAASLIVVSDGDTLPAEDRPTLGKAFREVTVLGVGNPFRGTLVHDHHSRQDRRSLSRLALQLNGQYFDANTHHLASSALPSDPAGGGNGGSLAWREAAVCAIFIGALVFALLPVALTGFGGAWNSRRQRPIQLSREELEQGLVAGAHQASR